MPLLLTPDYDTTMNTCIVCVIHDKDYADF
jgi:hypothetical protein